MITRRKAVLLGVAMPAAQLTAFAYGKEFWNTTNPDDWSAKEREQLLSKSPWAKEAIISFADIGDAMPPGRGGDVSGAGGRGPGGAGGPGGGMGAPGGGTGGPGGGMGGPPPPGDAAGEPSSFKALVRWESALPIRKASRKETPPEAADNYIISLSGLPMMGQGMTGGMRGRGRGPLEGESQSDQEERQKQLEERLQASTRLQVKGRDAIASAGVQNVASGQMILCLFPRKESLRPEDKEVMFLTKLGPMELRVRFALKDMVYRGKLEL